MPDLSRNIVIRASLQDLASANAARVTAGIRAIGAAATQSRGPTGSFIGTLAGFAAGGGISSLIGGVTRLARESADMARAQEVSQARLGVVLNDNVVRIKATQDAIDGVRRSSVYGTTELTSTAEQLLERGVSAGRLGQALQVAANVASALHQPLASVANEIAVTFGGTVPRQLGRIVPALHELSPAALEAGGALDVLAKAYDGRAAAFAATDPGKEVAALRDIEQAWTDIGKAVLPLERAALPAVAKGVGQVSQGIGAASAEGWKSLLDDVTNQVEGAFAFIGSLIFNLAVAQPIERAKLSVTALLAELNYDFTAMIAGVVSVVATAVTDVAKKIDGLTAGFPTTLNLTTHLTASIPDFTSGLSAAVATASAQANAAARNLRSPSAGGDLQRAIDAAADDRTRYMGFAAGAAGTPEQQAKAAANAAETRRQKLRVDSDAAVDAGRKSIAELAALDARGIQASDARHIRSAQTQARQEYDLHASSLDDYLAKLDETTAAERSRLAQTLADLRGQYHDLTNDPTWFNPDQRTGRAVEDQRSGEAVHAEHLKQLQADPDETLQRTKMLADAERQANINRAADLAHEVDLRKQIKQAQQELSDSERESAEARFKAVQDAVKTAPQNARQDVRAFQAGELSGDDLVGRANANLAQIDAAARSTVDSIDRAVRDGVGQIGGLSAEAGTAMKRRLAATAAQVRDQVQQEVTGVRSLSTASAEASRDLSKAATADIAGALTDVETRSKSAKQALLDLAQSFLKTMLQIANQRIAEQLVGGLSNDANGNQVQGGGLFGMLGSLAVGGSGKQVPTTSGVPTGGLLGTLFGKGGSNVSSGSGGGASSTPLGTINGAVGNTLGGAFGSAFNAASGAIGNIAGGVGQVASGASDALAQFIGHLFADGGYTGDGNPNEPAGIVHKGEYVIPAGRTAEHMDALRALRAGATPEHVATILDGPRLLNMRMTAPAAIRPQSADIAGAVGRAVGEQQQGQDGQPQVLPIVMNEHTAEQLANSPALQRQLARAQTTTHRALWEGVHKSFRR